MALSFFKQSDIDKMDANNIPVEFMNYFKSLSEDRKRQIISNRSDLASGLGFGVSVETEEIIEGESEIAKEYEEELELEELEEDENVDSEFAQIKENLYAIKFEEAIVDEANPIEILTVPEGTKKCLVHRTLFEEKSIRYRRNDGPTFGMVLKLCKECRRAYQEESRTASVDKKLSELFIEHTIYDVDLTTRYLKTQMPVYELQDKEKIYIPDIWIEEKPTCPIHNTELTEIPCEKVYSGRKVSFKGYLCDKCNKVLVRKAASNDLVDKCAVVGVPEIEFELLTKKAPAKKPVPTKEVKPDFFVEDGKRVEYNYSYTADCFKLTEDDTVVISDSVYCQLEGHNTEEVLALIMVNQKKGGRKAYLFMVGYCAQCQKFYMDEIDYRAVYVLGRPEVTVLSDIDDGSYQITSGEVFNLEKDHLKKLEADIEKDVTNIKNQHDYVAPGETESDKELQAQLQYKKEISKRLYGETLARLDGYTNKPYTYRVDITADDETEIYYIGASDVVLSDGKRVISYNDDFGRELVNYQTIKISKNGKEYDIKLSRQFDIDSAKLYGYANLRTDEDIIFKSGITDPFLVRVLNMRKKQHNLIDIIATIQENQNKIVDERFTQNIIVQGCAGSGKTMVLLHRLSRLKYKHRDFDFMENALILTPNDQFSLHIKDLAEGLQIGSIKRSSVEAYYLDMLMQYSTDFKPANKLVSEMGVKQVFVDYVYSDQFREDFEKAYNEVLNSRNNLIEMLHGLLDTMKQPHRNIDVNDNKNLVPQMEMIICTLEGKVAEVVESIKVKKEAVDKLIARKEFLINRLPESQKFAEGIVGEALLRVYSKIGKAVAERQHTIDDLKEQINNLKKELKNVANSINPFGKRAKSEKLEERIKKSNSSLRSELRKQEAENLIFQIQLTDKKDEEILGWISQVSAYIPGAKEEYRLCINTREEYANLSNEMADIDNQISNARVRYEEELLNEYSDDVKKTIVYLKEQLGRYDLLGTYQQTFDLATLEFRKKNEIKNVRGKSHRYDLYAQLLFSIKYFGSTFGNTRFMCVDEAQDLAINEYILLKTLNQNNLVFNLYGDVNQLIKSNRGIADWHSLEGIITAKEFELKENYRNTNQITRFCNNSFDMKVLQTGVDGAQVREISRSELEGELETLNIGTERVAILVPRAVQKGKYLKKELLSESVKEIIDDSLDNGHISLMYVDEVKGIEFDKVYVIGNRMSRNEKYIAYTRALSELIIVVDESIPDKKDVSLEKSAIGELVDFLRTEDMDSSTGMFEEITEEWTSSSRVTLFSHLFTRVNQSSRIFELMGKELDVKEIKRVIRGLSEEQNDSIHKNVYGKRLAELLEELSKGENKEGLAVIVEYFGAWNKLDDIPSCNKKELMLLADTPAAAAAWFSSLKSEDYEHFDEYIERNVNNLKIGIMFQLCMLAWNKDDISKERVINALEIASKANVRENNDLICPDNVLVDLACASDEENWTLVKEFILKASSKKFSDERMKRYPKERLKPQVVKMYEKLAKSGLTLEDKMFVFMNTSLREEVQLDKFLSAVKTYTNASFFEIVHSLRGYWIHGRIKHVTEDGFVRVAPSNIGVTRLITFWSQQIHITNSEGEWVEPHEGDEIYFIIQNYDKEKSHFKLHYPCLQPIEIKE